jgi:uncharacterized protein (DUF1499 family)
MRDRDLGWPARFTGLMVIAALSGSCGPTRAAKLGIRDAALQPCPASPNCVCSDVVEPSHHVAPLKIAIDAESAWREARDAVAAMPRTSIVEEHDDYLHAECRSPLFRFVDDLELDLRADVGIIAVRSASRLGYSDMGVNRRRVEQLRAVLQARGAVAR